MPDSIAFTFLNTPSPLTRSDFADPWLLFIAVIASIILLRAVRIGAVSLPETKTTWLISLAMALIALIFPFLVTIKVAGYSATLISGVIILAAAYYSGPFGAIISAFFAGFGETLFSSAPIHEFILLVCFTGIWLQIRHSRTEVSRLFPDSPHVHLLLAVIATLIIASCEPVLGFANDRFAVSAISLAGCVMGGSFLLLIRPERIINKPYPVRYELRTRQKTPLTSVGILSQHYLLLTFISYYAFRLFLFLGKTYAGISITTLEPMTLTLLLAGYYTLISLGFILFREKKQNTRNREIESQLVDISNRRFTQQISETSDPVAIEIGNLEKSLKKMLFEQEKLVTIARLISANQELFRIIHPILNAAMEGTGALSARIAFMPQYSQGDMRKYVSGNLIRELDSYDKRLLQNVQNNGALVVNDLARAGTFNIEFPAGVTSLIALPLESERSTYGILWLSYDSQRRMEAANFDFLFALAGEANVAITNTSLFEMLNEEHDKLEAVLLSMNDGLIVSDIQGKLLLINATARKLFGIDASGYQNRRANEVLSEPTLVDFIYDFSGIQRSAELQIGSETFETKVSTIYNPNGRMLGRVINLSNITHLKELDSLKTVFLRMVSHDLRTYLNIILGFAELLEDSGTLTEDQELSVKRILYGVNQIELMVRQISRLSYLQFGEKASLAFDNIDLHDLIRGLVTELTGTISKKKITVNLDFDENSGVVIADHVLLPQALLNLIQNAVKYTDPEGSITIRTFSTDESLINITIQDTGRGIDRKLHEKIFDPFFRIVDDNQPQEGQGLGLTLVRLISELHGGKITVDSEPGSGSTFTISLPRIHENNEETTENKQ